jgi:hypothetical protein
MRPALLNPRIMTAPLACAFAWWLGMPIAATPEATSETTTRLMTALDQSARRRPVPYKAYRQLYGELLEKNEQGWMQVLTEFDPENGLRYAVLSEGGSSRIRNRALRHMLDREVGACRKAETQLAAFSTDNYRYQLGAVLGGAVQIDLVPRREDPRLINGTATLHQSSASLLRVEGELAKSPSFWLTDVHVARRYFDFGGLTMPVEVESSAHVRLFGDARLRMTIQYIAVDGRPVGDAPQLLPFTSASSSIPPLGSR